MRLHAAAAISLALCGGSACAADPPSPAPASPVSQWEFILANAFFNDPNHTIILYGAILGNTTTGTALDCGGSIHIDGSVYYAINCRTWTFTPPPAPGHQYVFKDISPTNALSGQGYYLPRLSGFWRLDTTTNTLAFCYSGNNTAATCQQINLP
jgi:hypothetical protein